MSDFPQVIDTSATIISPVSPQSIIHHRTLFGVSASATWPVANTAIFIPFRVAQPTQIVKIFWQNGGAVSGNIDVGIYDLQGNRLVSLGSTAQTGISAIQIGDITDTILQTGVYYMAMAMDNVTGTQRRFAPTAPLTRAMGIYNVVSAFPLPSTVTFAGATNAYFPVPCLTTRVLV
jgi:hypothetical protein